MICVECNEREAVRVPRSLLPICELCCSELANRPPPVEPAGVDLELRQARRGQLGLFGQVEL